MSDLLYTVFTTIAPAYETEFNVWQETEHCPYLMELPGYQSVIRYKDLERPYRYANFWHICSMRDFGNPERLTRAKTPWGNFLSPYRDRRIDFYVQDDGLMVSPPLAEISETFTLLLMETYSDVADAELNLTPTYRDLRLRLKQLPGVLDVRLYHAYERRGVDENCVFYYLKGSEEQIRSRVLPSIDYTMGTAVRQKNRSLLQRISKNKKL